MGTIAEFDMSVVVTMKLKRIHVSVLDTDDPDRIGWRFDCELVQTPYGGLPRVYRQEVQVTHDDDLGWVADVGRPMTSAELLVDPHEAARWLVEQLGDALRDFSHPFDVGVTLVTPTPPL